MKHKKIARFSILLGSVILLGVSLLTSPASFTQAAPISFKDITNHWAKSTIVQAVKDGYIAGYQDGTFKPNGSVTRAEFATLLTHISKNTGTGSVSFSDLPPGHWAYSSIMQAVGKGFISPDEYGDQIQANKIMTRAEISKWLSHGLIASHPDYATAYSDLDGTVIPVSEYF